MLQKREKSEKSEKRMKRETDLLSFLLNSLITECHDKLMGPLPSTTAFPLRPAACEPALHPVGPAAAHPGLGLPRSDRVAVMLLRVRFDSVIFKGNDMTVMTKIGGVEKKKKRKS